MNSFNFVGETDYYANYSSSKWNSSIFSTNPSAFSFYGDKPIMDISLNLPDKVVKKINNVNIDVDVKSIKDLITIVETNEYRNDTIYNIDLKY